MDLVAKNAADLAELANRERRFSSSLWFPILGHNNLSSLKISYLVTPRFICHKTNLGGTSTALMETDLFFETFIFFISKIWLID